MAFSALQIFGPTSNRAYGGLPQSFESSEAGCTAITPSEQSRRFRDSLAHLGVLGPLDRCRLPTFMIVSPPKTGTSWLFSRLWHHPQVALPREKETRFFSTFYRWCDLHWYLSRFGDKPAIHRGEATPAYALLPPSTIEAIHALVPDLKLIFLLRDPVDRAWSHARHNWRHGEANFASRRPPLEQISDADWRENFYHPWPSISGDYLGQLRRWRAFFPRKQIYVCCFEQMVAQPLKLLNEVFEFLGLDSAEASQRALEDRVNEGLPVASSDSILRTLRHVYSGRTRQLVNYLRDEFGVSVPDAWRNTLANDSSNLPDVTGPMQVAAEHEFDDDFLANVIQHEQHPVEPLGFSECYMGYELFLYRQKVYALASHLRRGFLNESRASELEAAQRSGFCLSADSVAKVKERIAHVLLQRPMAVEVH